MKRNRWIICATKMASNLCYKYYRFCAVAVRGGSILGIGYNNPHKGSKAKKYPCRGLHAEMHLVSLLGDNIAGATVYVAGLTSCGNVPRYGCCPCAMCQEALKKSGVKKVMFLTNTGHSTLLL
jgi:tRNA(Arg) A34 adenosine deaminase TadA